MKQAFCFMLFAGVLFCTACTKAASERKSNELAGRWKLIAMLHDAGEGKSSWQAVPEVQQRLLLLTPQHHLTGDAFPQARSYEIINAALLKFLYADGTFIYYNYKQFGDTLELSGGGCIEACGLRFENQNASN